MTTATSTASAPNLFLRRDTFSSLHRDTSSVKSSRSSTKMPMGFFSSLRSSKSSRDRQPASNSPSKSGGDRPMNRSPAATAPLRFPPLLDPDAAPPPYTTQPFSPADLSTSMQTGDDSPYAFLREFDTVFLIDDSGSMAGRSWRETASALAAIAPICTQHDADGIDIYFLNHRNSNDERGGYTHVTTPREVQRLFERVRPLGGTPLGTRLNHLLRPYLRDAEAGRSATGELTITAKPLNIIVMTDGVPSDDVESVLVAAARRLDALGAEAWQVGVQFFQVGREPEATAMLQELDDALSATYGIRDMVDTVPFTGDTGHTLTADGLLKVCLGSVVRRHDRRHV